MMLLKFLRRVANRAGSSNPDSRSAALGWKLVSTGSGLLTGLVVRKVLNLAWSKFSSTDRRPPFNPADREVTWTEALAWSVATGAGVGVARLVSDRVAATGWELAVGQPPPGIHTAR